MTECPLSSSEITAEWLNHVLSHEVRGGATVTNVEPQIIGEGVGFLGEVARLSLTYDQPSASSTMSVIAKSPTTNEGFKALGLTLGFYEKESGFFRDVAPEVRLRIPECFHNYSANGTDFMLLLEDLAPMRPGDQLASCTLAEAEQALAAAAKLHARWWESPRLDEFASWLPSTTSPYFDILKGAYLGSLEKFHAEFSYLVTPEVEALADRGGEDYEAMMAAGVGRSPHTFIHGDYRLDNMMFGDSPDVEPFAVLDWQLPFKANPMWDVVYFLGGNLDTDQRREHQDKLVEAYHKVLVDEGVTNYTLEKCREDYRAAGLVLLGYLVTGALDVDLDTLNERGRELMETIFRRYSTTITDLNSGEFL